MDVKKFVVDYKKYLKQNADPKRAVNEKAYLYSDLKHYGLSVWTRRKFSNEHEKELKTLSKKDVIDLALELWGSPYHEERAMGLTIIGFHKEKLDISDMPLIEKIMRESKGWAFLDSSIIPFMHEILQKDKGGYDFLKRWIKDDDFWVRRSALLAQLLFFRSNKGGNKKLFFNFARSQFDEKWIDEKYKDKLSNKRAKFFIRKAIGWALREMSQKDPKAVFDFLEENKGRMSGLSFREGSRKLPETFRNNL